MAPLTNTQSIVERPTIDDLTGDSHFAQLARKHWLGKTKKVKVLAETLEKDIWDPIQKSGYALYDLLLLEQLQCFERYLWPGFTDNVSNHHALLLVLLVNVKRREGLPVWGVYRHLLAHSRPILTPLDTFSDRSADFSAFFRRVLQMTLDKSIPLDLQTHLLTFVIGAFQSLDNGLVRKECASLVSIGIWQNLHSDAARQHRLDQATQVAKAWRASTKRYDSSDEPTQLRIRFERTWLHSLLLLFFDKLYDTQLPSTANAMYCERIVELLSDLQSQLPTRRYVNTLVQDLNTISIITLSPLYASEDNRLLRDLVDQLQHYTDFPIDDNTGKEFSFSGDDQSRRHTRLATLQKTAFQAHPDKLKLLVLANYASLESRDELKGHLRELADDQLISLCDAVGLRTLYPQSARIVRDRTFHLDTLLYHYERRPTYQERICIKSILPTEADIYDQVLTSADEYSSARPLPLPKLNLQYLTMGDFLWRSFVLYRAEAMYAIRKDLEGIVRKVSPRQAGTNIKFDGFSRQAIPITKPAIIDVLPPKVGELHPAKVEIEISLDFGGVASNVIRQWESLNADEVVYLLSVQPPSDRKAITNGHTDAPVRALRHLRCAEVVDLLDDNGRRLYDLKQKPDYLSGQLRRAKLLLRLDPVAYHRDQELADNTKVGIYDNINLLVRRQARENNFKAVLESVRHLALSDVPAPSWLQEVFLGYSDPAAATYQRLPNRLRSIDYRDTFVDWKHLVGSFPAQDIVTAGQETSLSPPFVLETVDAPEPERPSKKRRREQPPVETTSAAPSQIKVSSYAPKNTGPYPSLAPKHNQIAFTPTQVEAITSGTQPGLTVVVGPPGTGKTDVVTQIVNNIYHDFPEQRTLLVAHSNQALNQLFQKIMKLDIDERHLLRLGHGEGELESDSDYSKHGRVESLLENAARQLYKVTRLATSIDAPGAHGTSCETAEYFHQVYIDPAWKKFWAMTGSAQPHEIADAFPFHAYFRDAPQPLFPPDANREQVLDIASGCHYHISHIFDTLSDTRPFEILRSAKDKADYLLIKEARIVAMTCTHAAMRRQQIAELGFRYDNVIMEEAAQITEIENFIPLALQKPRDGDMPLQRVVLVGDHLQNSPVIQNEAFKQYANLEQSLFLRLVRLGVPTIMLDQQGRARPSLAELYKWRYPQLGNLPAVQTLPEFQTANAGFRHDYQFIDVQDYKGQGETEPSMHFVQNLGEAEYAVALYQYMRLLGYPANKISILTMYAGQRNLIRDVLTHRCGGASNSLFGMPGKVMTADKYQGEQNDCEWP